MFHEIVTPISENRRHVFDVTPIFPGTNTSINPPSNAIIMGQDLVLSVDGDGGVPRAYASGSVVARVSSSASIEARTQCAYIIQTYGLREECVVYPFNAFEAGSGYGKGRSGSSLGPVGYHFAPGLKATSPARTIGKIWSPESTAVILPLISSMEVSAEDDGDSVRRTLECGKAYLIDPGARFKIFAPIGDGNDEASSFLVYSPTWIGTGD